MAERVAVRDISDEEGNKLLSIIRRGSGSVVRWRRAQIVLWSAQHMDVPAIAKIAFTSEDRVREVIHNFNRDGFDSLAPKYAGGRPPKFSAAERAEVKKIALGRPTGYGEPFSTWSLTKLADHLVRKGVVEDISHEGLRALPREEGVSFQAIKTWKESNDPDFELKKNRILELYDLADGKVQAGPGDPDVVICYDDEFGPLNLQPHPGRHWAERDTSGAPRSAPRRRRRATYIRPHGMRHLLAAYDLFTDKLYGHVKTKKGRSEFLAFLRYVRSLHPPQVRIAIVLDNFSPHLSTKKDTRVGDWARANNVELAYSPHYASWLNRIEAQFTALRYFCLDGTDHQSHEAQAFLIRRYIAWRNRNAQNKALRELVKRANVA
jgi:transposase